ncbi:MAG: ABC-three component system protein [Akkermansiaceae bacterium]
MTEKARQYRPSHVRRLDTLSRNECAAPDCERALVARDGETIVSKICHIEAASGKGPRFNPKMSDDERRHYNNLILLCDECHGIIDNLENEPNYPVKLLREWKKEHESKGLTSLNTKKSLLLVAINAIASSSLEDIAEAEETKSSVFDIEGKIAYNDVVRNKPLIDEYKIFYTKIASLYGELEKQGSFKKERLLRNVRRLYLKVRGSYISDVDDPTEAIQKNADSIIEDIEEALVASCSSENALYDEDVAFGVSIIMVDAFMRCKILEEPPLL